MNEVLRDRDIDFLLYEFLDTASLLERPRYRQHSVDVFRETVDAARTVAAKYLLPHYQRGDANEPTFDGSKVTVLPDTHEAWQVIRDSGFLKAGCDEADGGLQLPEVIVRTVMTYFQAANTGSSAYAFLTFGVINLLRTFGSPQQKAKYLPLLIEGEATGTMALTEPSQGSALADIKTRAVRQADGTWRIFGQKQFISGGEHDLTSNIVHMVLAKSNPEAPGVQGISLFIVPKFQVQDDGAPGERNDVALAGLLHKMGWRNATSTILNFGEKDGAVGYLIGPEGKGLACMFQMMNEARIGVGIAAAAIALRGYLYSLDYAKQRRQGRLPSNKDARTPQVSLIDHADVRRMLLAQKAYAEGAIALCLYAASLCEDEHTLADESGRRRAAELLDLLTPVVKTWPSRYGCQSNDLAIQVLGGAGYMREYPVEQLYRDQRLNPIHEGTEGIHGIDILGRKVRMNGGLAVQHFAATVRATVQQAAADSRLRSQAQFVELNLALLLETTSKLLAFTAREPDAGLSNATIYLDVFGRVTVAWLWLMQAVVASQALAKGPSADDTSFYNGKLQAAAYYIEWELPQIRHQCALLTEPNLVPFHTRADWL
jgi:alkylation response protein AidB-like acyl-CoA dehydrogenase